MVVLVGLLLCCVVGVFGAPASHSNPENLQPDDTLSPLSSVPVFVHAIKANSIPLSVLHQNHSLGTAGGNLVVGISPSNALSISWQLGWHQDQGVSVRGCSVVGGWVRIDRMSNLAQDSPVAEAVWRSDVDGDSTHVMYNGPKLSALTRYCATVAMSVEFPESSRYHRTPAAVRNTACFETSTFNDDWNDTQWIGRQDSNLLRSSFQVASNDLEQAVAARMLVSGLGWARPHLNGQIVSKSEKLGVGWSTYAKRCLFVTYDVLDALQIGENAFGVELGFAWRDRTVFPWLSGKSDEPYTPRALRMKLLLQFGNGSWSELLATRVTAESTEDSNLYDWRGAQGPITADSVYDGETWDARLEKFGWDRSAYDTRGWQQVASVQSESWAQTAQMAPSEFPPVRTISTHNCSVLVSTNDGANTAAYLFDCGLNQAGVAAITLPSMSSGQTLTLRHAETLMHPPYGTFYPSNTSAWVYTDNLDTAQATDRYISNGNDQGRVYSPVFTYHGFRYIVLLGWPVAADAPTVMMDHFRTAVELTGHVVTSDDTLNAIQRMAVGAQLSNLMSVITDCPQRDERLGWMGDAGLSADSMAINFDMAALHNHIMDEIVDELGDDGSVPDVVPHMRLGKRPGDPSWSAAFVQIAYAQYKYMGNIQIFQKYSNEIARYLDNIAQQVEQGGGLSKMASWGPYGDWVPAKDDQKPSTTLTSAFNWIVNLKQAKEMSQAIGDTAGAAMYDAKLSAVKAEAIRAFLRRSDDGAVVFGNNGQTALSLGLSSDLFENDDDTLLAILTNLINDVTARDYHVTVGIIGAKELFTSLSRYGHGPLALKVLQGKTAPGYGYMLSSPYEPAINNMWELWYSDVEGPAMNSRNHHMFSSVSLFIYYLAGLNDIRTTGLGTTSPLHLHVGGCCGGLTHATIQVATNRGDLSFAWTAHPLSVSASVPTGLEARLFVPMQLLGIARNGSVTCEGLLNRQQPVRVTDHTCGESSVSADVWTSSSTPSRIAGLRFVSCETKHNVLVFSLVGGRYDLKIT
eukprot:c20754_g1_i3.p1 GENE.c20754_g1_i3~~c20754_g1_i3.p1  ORF type:complete len:1027 (+),score=203.08 c20754_g1_i3:42-3122(+)